MEITACPKCGSRRIFQGRLKEGVLTGYTSNEVCRDCGYHGSPLIFDTIDDYNKFLEGLKLTKTSDDTYVEDETIEELSDKEKEVVGFLKEMSEEEKNESIEKKKPKFLKNSLIWLSIVVLIGGIWIASRAGFLSMYGISLILVGVILFIIGILSPQEDKDAQMDANYSTKTTIGGIFLMMAGVLSFITWIDIPYLLQEKMTDPLFLKEFGLDVYPDAFLSYILIIAIIGIVFSIFAIFGGLLAIKRKSWKLVIVFGFMGLLTLGPLFSSSILSFVGLIFIIYSKDYFIK